MLNDFKFREITPENFFEYDKRGSNKEISRELAIEATKFFFEAQLSEKVPKDTRELFEVARAVMIYGVNFYPLYTVGAEQLFRVAENALRMKCNQTGIVPNQGKYMFANMLGALIKNRVIKREYIDIWNSFKKLRNIFSHPEFQQLFPPGDVLDWMDLVSEHINQLFES